MKFFRFPGFVFILASVVWIGCGQKTAGPAVATAPVPTTDDQLPFARGGSAGGISPTSTVIPPSAHVPSGTPLTIHLQNEISSATAQPGDTFEAVLDEPVTLNGQVLAERGTAVTGRVMEARRADSDRSPGYLRLTLGSILLKGKTCAVRSSSSFIKAVFPRRVNLSTSRPTTPSALQNASAIDRETAQPSDDDRPSLAVADVTLGPQRRLTFRLTEPVPLPE